VSVKVSLCMKLMAFGCVRPTDCMPVEQHYRVEARGCRSTSSLAGREVGAVSWTTTMGVVGFSGIGAVTACTEKMPKLGGTGKL
jgi:hypothetical protein